MKKEKKNSGSLSQGFGSADFSAFSYENDHFRVKLFIVSGEKSKLTCLSAYASLYSDYLGHQNDDTIKRRLSSHIPCKGAEFTILFIFSHV